MVNLRRMVYPLERNDAMRILASSFPLEWVGALDGMA